MLNLFRADRANSFVGTAEYVSPELLQSKVAYKRYVYMSACTLVVGGADLKQCFAKAHYPDHIGEGNI